MKKMFAVCAAAAAITTVSAMAVSAEGITVTPDKDATAQSVVVKLKAGYDVKDEAAIIIFEKSSDPDKNATPTDDMIVYLNQQAADEAKKSGFLSGAEVLPKKLEKDTTYVVRVGDSTNDKYYEDEFTYGKEEEIAWGDVDRDSEVNALDANLILNYSVENIKFDDYQLKVADVYYDGSVDALDANIILNYSVENIKTLPVMP